MLLDYGEKTDVTNAELRDLLLGPKRQTLEKTLSFDRLLLVLKCGTLAETDPLGTIFCLK